MSVLAKLIVLLAALVCASSTQTHIVDAVVKCMQSFDITGVSTSEVENNTVVSGNSDGLADMFNDNVVARMAEDSLTAKVDIYDVDLNGSVMDIYYNVKIMIDESASSAAQSLAAQAASAAVATVIAKADYQADFTTAMSPQGGSAYTMTAKTPGVPLSFAVVLDRSPEPTATPTMAPTVRAEYIASPILVAGASGVIIFVAFLWFVNRTPAETVKKAATHHMNPASAHTTKPAAAGAAYAAKETASFERA